VEKNSQDKASVLKFEKLIFFFSRRFVCNKFSSSSSDMSTPGQLSKANKTDFIALAKAVRDCLTEKKPIKSTAHAHGIPRSTLQRYMKKVKARFDALSSVGDGVLVEFLSKCNQKIPPQRVRNCLLSHFSLANFHKPKIFANFFARFSHRLRKLISLNTL